MRNPFRRSTPEAPRLADYDVIADALSVAGSARGQRAPGIYIDIIAPSSTTSTISMFRSI